MEQSVQALDLIYRMVFPHFLHGLPSYFTLLPPLAFGCRFDGALDAPSGTHVPEGAFTDGAGVALVSDQPLARGKPSLAIERS